MFNKHHVGDTMKDYAAAIIIGLALAVLALEYFDVLVK
jgi:hypothetical protein